MIPPVLAKTSRVVVAVYIMIRPDYLLHRCFRKIRSNLARYDIHILFSHAHVLHALPGWIPLMVASNAPNVVLPLRRLS